MDFENESEQMGPDATQELMYAKEELDARKWGNLQENLREFAKKVELENLSSDQKQVLRDQFDALREDIESTDIPKKEKRVIDGLLKEVDRVL